MREALTSVSKHANSAAVTVSVAGHPGQGLRISVRNQLPGGPAGSRALPGTGMGLAGLAERAAVAGGTIAHGLDPSGDFVLNAALRWPA